MFLTGRGALMFILVVVKSTASGVEDSSDNLFTALPEDIKNIETKQENLEDFTNNVVIKKLNSMENHFNRLISELQSQNLDRIEDIAILKANKKENEKRTKSNQEEIVTLKLQNSILLSRIDQLEKEKHKIEPDISTVNVKYSTLLPKNCKDLSNMGHTLNGIYLVRGDDDNSNSNNIDVSKILSVHCIFGTEPGPVTKKLGYISTKSTLRGVQFFIQKNRPFENPSAILPFDSVKLNVGEGMNAQSGAFIAPVSGIYFFSFKGMKNHSKREISVYIRVNGISIGEAYAPGILGGVMLAIQATLKLKKGDRVDLFHFSNEGGALYDNEKRNTHFIGWLLEEHDIIYSPY